MPSQLSPAEVLKVNRARAARMAQEAGAARTRKLLERAQRDLNRRIDAHLGAGDGKEPFSLAQMRVTLAQIKDTLHDLKGGMRSAISAHGRTTAEESAQGTMAYLEQAEQMYRGINQPLDIDRARVVDRAVAGANSSILHRLEGDPKHPGILERYDSSVIESFEEELQLRYVARTPWADVRNNLTAASPFLQGKPMSWAERIVRTESMAASNSANLETIKGAEQELGDMVKILSATFDGRTSSDSYDVHGQIRRPSEAFLSWFGTYMHPPNRPNDRETVVPHRISWPIPAGLAPKSDGEVAARWAFEGRKGAPPRRSLPSSTVDRELFGKTPPPKIEAAPTSVQVPEQIETQPEPEPEAPKTPQQKAYAALDAMPTVKIDSPYADAGEVFVKTPHSDKKSKYIEQLGGANNFYAIADQALGVHKKVPISKYVASSPAAAMSSVKEYIDEPPAPEAIELIKWKGKFYSSGYAVNEKVIATLATGKTKVAAIVQDLDTHLNVVKNEASAKLQALIKEGKPYDGPIKAKSLVDAIAEPMKFWDAVNKPKKKNMTAEPVPIDAIKKLPSMSAAPQILEQVKMIGEGKAPIKKPTLYKIGPDYFTDSAGAAHPIEAMQMLTKLKTIDAYVIDLSHLLSKQTAPPVVPWWQQQKAPETGFGTLPAAPIPESKSVPKTLDEKLAALPKVPRLPSERSVPDRMEVQFNDNLADDYENVAKITREERAGVGGFTYGSDWLIRRHAQGHDREETIKMEMSHRSSLTRAEAEERYDAAVKFNDGIESLFKRAKPRPMMVYRGIGNLSREVFEKIIAMDEIEIDAPTSTSWRASVAQGFLKSGNRVFFRWNQKSGIGIKPLSDVKSEDEILVPKGARFRVTGRQLLDDPYSGGTTVIIDAEEI